MLSASGLHNTVKYTYSGPSYSDHLLDGTKKGPSSLSEYHRMTTRSHPRFPVERSSQYWQKLTSLLLRFCGLALCQNRILFKLKNLLIQVKKKNKKTLLCCFYNQIRGWGNFDLFKNVFFYWYLLWFWGDTIFSRLVLRRRALESNDYHFLWITVHVKSWARDIIQKQLMWNKQKHLFAYENVKSLWGEKGEIHTKAATA